MGFCTGESFCWPRARPRRSGSMRARPCIRCAHGTPDPTWSQAGARHERALLDRLRQRRLVDLLRAGARRLLRARADADRLLDHRRDLLPDRRHLRRGDRDVPRGRRLVELRAPRLQRAVVVLRRVGADAQLHDHDRHLGVLRAALPRRAVLAGAAARPRRRAVRDRRRRRAVGRQRRRRQRGRRPEHRAGDHRPRHAAAAGDRRHRARALAGRAGRTTCTSASRRRGKASSWRSPSG